MEREIYYTALHRRVLIVYTVSYGEWSAYCTPVPGESHEREKHRWQEHGTKLMEHQARGLWPALAEDFDRKRIRWRR